MVQIGDVFQTFEEFEIELKKLSEETYTHFTRANSRQYKTDCELNGKYEY